MSRQAQLWFAAAVAAVLLTVADRQLASRWPVSPLFVLPILLAAPGVFYFRSGGSADDGAAPERLFRRIVESAPNAVIVVDGQGRIILANSQTEVLFGHSRPELLGQPMEMLVPPRYRSAHEGHRRDFGHDPAVRTMGAGRDLYGLRKDGSEVAVEIGLNPIQTENGTLVLASIIDITARKQAEERLVRSLREKEILIQEIHHRVKNNLAVIGSLFYLQASATDNAETVAILTDCRQRVRSMAMVHERLYRSDDLASVDLADYAAELARQLHMQYALDPQRIRLKVDCDPTRLGIDQAIPFGLILTELLSNALKHAFPDDREGTIDITLENRTGGLILTVGDNGIGLPGQEILESTQSLGMRLVRSLAGQLGARLHIDQRRPGTEVRLSLERSHGDLQ